MQNFPVSRNTIALLFCLYLFLLGIREVGAATLPQGFQETPVLTGMTQPTAVRFAPNGQIFVAEKSGLLWAYDDLNDVNPDLVVDLREYVHNFWDRGFLGLAIPPDYPANSAVYVLYAHDIFPDGTGPRWGTGGPNPSTADPCPNPPGATDDGCVIFGRLSRIDIDLVSMQGIEVPLIEANWCQQYPSHSVGDLLFGEDGYLYVSTGDGSSFGFGDWGQKGNPINPCDDAPDGIGGPNNGPDAEGGSFRSLDIITPNDPTSLDGTVLRVDVSGATVQAPVDNPLVNNSITDDDLIVAIGLRNPFRIAKRPGTFEIWVADVGWGNWEEINVFTPSASIIPNFGWPCYEGGDGTNLQLGAYASRDICQDVYNNNVPPGIIVTSSYYAYHHTQQVVSGELCGSGSSSVTGLAFNTGNNYPSGYGGALFFADSSRRCVWTMFTDQNGDPDKTNILSLISNASGRVVDLQMGLDDKLYYVDFDGGQLFRIDYFAVNQPPVAVIAADQTNGLAPLTVQFDASSSSDAEDGSNLLYSWDLDNDGAFDDGATANVSWTYTLAGVHGVGLRVEDTQGAFDIASMVITAGNTPPVVTITAPADTTTWTVGQQINFSGEAIDPQNGALPAAQMSWDFILHHCATVNDCHTHPVTSLPGVASGSIIAPDHEYPSFLELQLTAEDLPPTDWYDPAWGKRRQITIDNSGQTETLINFPLLVVLDSTRIDYAQASIDGRDIRFTDAFGNLLPYEIESWIPFGLSYIWVQVPAIQAAANTDYIYLYYDNPQIGGGAEDPAALWADYAGVWHLNGDTLDSSPNNNHGTDGGSTSISGLLSNARYFNGSAYIEVPDSPSLQISGELTIEAWIAIDDPNLSGAPRVVSKKTIWNAPDGYNMEYKPAVNNVTSVGGGSSFIRANNIDLDTNWHLIGAVHLGGGVGQVYVDGVNVTGDGTVNPLVAGTTVLRIGQAATGGGGFLGAIDEVRLSTLARSREWMRAQYLSMSDSYVSYSAEELPATLSATTSIMLDPQTVDITMNSSPVGLMLTLGPKTLVAPFTETVIVGTDTQVDAVSPQTLNATQYQFISWSDGSPQTHSLVAPSSNLTLTASFDSSDTTPPTTPTGLVLLNRSKTFIKLGWSASTDIGGSGVAGYRVFRNGVQIATTTATSYTNFGLTAGTTYTYTVAAYDTAGNQSPQSAPFIVKTKSNSAGSCYIWCHQ